MHLLGKLKAQERAWRTNPRIGMEAMLSTDFGESFIAYLLSKEGVDVVRASSIGFDLFAVDKNGKIFPKGKIACISVKTRISKRYRKYRPTIPVGSKKLMAATEIWSADAWVGIVVGTTRQNKELAAFLFPLKDLDKLKGAARREDVVAVSELYENPTDKTIRLF